MFSNKLKNLNLLFYYTHFIYNVLKVGFKGNFLCFNLQYVIFEWELYCKPNSLIQISYPNSKTYVKKSFEISDFK